MLLNICKLIRCNFIIILFVTSPFLLFGQVGVVLPTNTILKTDTVLPINTIVEPKTKPFHFITNVPYNIGKIAKAPLYKSNRKGLLITVAATALLLPFDQVITDGVKNISNQIHLNPETDYKVPIQFGTTKILKIPQNLNSALYQLGEGGTSMLLAGGLFMYGKIKHNKLAITTASDLTETFITMGITTQLLKRMSGRESPFTATDEGGVWRPFPKFRNYQLNTSNYDAFPSGHLATMMATVTTMVLNYPTKKWIKPVGYSLIGLTGFAMINTDVHWISDYPLALALGYISAKITYLKNHRKQHPKSYAGSVN
jgi:membrane-associated phospholipid phosphatase